MLDEAFKPIPEFDTWVGTFGTPELREQDKQARALCNELKLTLKYPAWLRYLEADRAYQTIRNRQQAMKATFQFTPSGLNEFFWDPAKMNDRLQKLLDDGLIGRADEKTLRLRR